MRVLHFKSRYLNASETFVDRLVRGHVAFEPAVATVEPRQYADGLRLYAPRSRLERFVNEQARRLNRVPPVLARAVREWGPDVLHAHAGLDGYRALGLARRVPLVVSFYGSDVTRLPNERGWRARYARLAREGAAFTTVSDAMRAALVGLGFPANRLRVVRQGVALGAFAHVPREGVGETPVWLLMVGRMVEKKGFAYALDALAGLRARGVDAHLRLVGDGPLRSTLEARAAALGLGEAVRFDGAAPNDVVRDHLRTHGVLLAPSVTAADGDQEGIPNTIIEALAVGIPVVATHHAGIPEIVFDGETGLLVPERDADALAAGVERYLADADLVARVSRAGRALVERSHAVGTMVGGIEAAYRDAIEQMR